MNIVQAFVTIRKARKMTQKELAERCGTDDPVEQHVNKHIED